MAYEPFKLVNLDESRFQETLLDSKDSDRVAVVRVCDIDAPTKSSFVLAVRGIEVWLTEEEAFAIGAAINARAYPHHQTTLWAIRDGEMVLEEPE